MDTAEVTPLATASFFSIITFAWIAPILTIGATRPLIKEDLWRLDDDRKVDILADRLWENFLKRKQKVEEWNVKVENGEIGKSGLRRFWWRVKGNPDGKKKIGLAGALSDTFFWSFWTAGFIKVISDTLQVTSPLVTKAIIEFGTDTYLAQRSVPGYTVPPIGRGVGAAIGLFLMQIVSSLCMHNFFYRTMEVGVLSRGALISTIYRRAMVLSGKSRAEIPNGKLVNHISTDVSRIDL
jgi:ATP-binding cassette subfamily C (CFTR/MRP) protein 1